MCSCIKLRYLGSEDRLWRGLLEAEFPEYTQRTLVGGPQLSLCVQFAKMWEVGALSRDVSL